METQNPKTKNPAAAATPAAKTPPPTPAPVSGRVPALFRKIDWFALAIAFGVVWIVYFLTLAPELTLEDSGELCTGAFYAGIPHPPGYPFWTIYAWFWTAILPVGNVAWRVEVGEATAAAMACGLVALMVSRGSSMLMESIEELKSLTGKWENAICVVSGIVSGIMLGLGGVVWSESVAINRISLFGLPWMMVVMVCLLRWIYAPHQRRYLFYAFFFFGLCATIHQTLIVAAMGIEAAIAAAQPRLGRNLFLGNGIVFLAVLIAQATHLTNALNILPMLLAIFYAVGIGSIAAYVWLAISTKETFDEFCLDGAAAIALVFMVLTPTYGLICGVLALAAFGTFFALAWKTWKLGHEWLIVFVCFILCCLGAAFYLYEPIAGMTNPPMQWGYPRTKEGFFHALGRGQYEQPNPTDLFTAEGRELFLTQLGMLLSDIAMEFNWVMLFLALIPLLFFLKMRKRERSWIIGLSAVYFFIAILLVILMHPTPDRQSSELHKVFFTSSHGVIAIMAGYGLALTAAYMATHYQKFRVVGLWIGILTLLPALIALYNGVNNTFYGDTGSLPFRDALYLFCCLAAAFVLTARAAQWFIQGAAEKDGASGDQRFLSLGYGVAALICLCMAVKFAFFNEKSLQFSQVMTALNHLFSPNQYNLPILAGLLILGTSLAFIGSLVFYRQRGPLAITLGLFAIMPIASGLAHWGASEQRNHWFGYWFGHDMFTPPFVAADGKLSYDADLRQTAMKGTNAALVYPEMTKDAILFGGTDPGRFCPTYMIFCESFTPHAQQPKEDQKFDRRDVYIITQNALADGTYMDYIRAHYNRSKQIDPPFFQELLRGTNEIQQNYTTNFLARMAYQFLDKPLTELGARIEARRRKEGVYPREEIYIPTPLDSEVCYRDYMSDVQQRLDHDQRFPNEPKQIKPGELVIPRGDGTVSVSGQTSVMAINGLLCKVIFDHCPSNEFFVEESFPLDWMYPYLSPFGVIMKINRQPVEEMTAEAVKRDHEFWSRYSERLIGNWMTYDTTVKEITDFVQKVYLQHDYSGFKGNRRFVRDEQAQKSFSKLRSAIGGSIYEWRFQHPKNAAEQQRMLKEANFALAQAFAFCPSSPEAVYHYVVLLMNLGRIDDALQVALTWQKLDPYNESANGMVNQLTSMKSNPTPPPTAAATTIHATVEQMEKEFSDHPTDYQNALSLVGAYMQTQRADKATAVLDQILVNPAANQEILQFVAEAYGQLGNFPKLEATVEKLTRLDPHSPEWWYNLAAIKLMLGKAPEALSGLSNSLDENAKRLVTNSKAVNLLIQARTDPRFAALHTNAEFQQLVK